MYIYEGQCIEYAQFKVFLNMKTRKDGDIVKIVDINFNLDIHLAFAQKFICLKSFSFNLRQNASNGKTFPLPLI